MKVLSRLASPAGFALVLLLFFVLPFLSVSCDVPGYGEAGLNYKGTHLVTGAEPATVIPAGLEELTNDPSSSANVDAPSDGPGVRVLAIVLAVLAAAGVLTGLIPRVRTRLFGAAAAAGATMIVTIVTMVVAQSNLESALIAETRNFDDEGQTAATGIADGIEEMVHTDVGFWLIVVILVLIGLLSTGAALFGGRLRAAVSGGAGGGEGAGAGLAGLSFGGGPEPGQPAVEPERPAGEPGRPTDEPELLVGEPGQPAGAAGSATTGDTAPAATDSPAPTTPSDPPASSQP